MCDNNLSEVIITEITTVYGMTGQTLIHGDVPYRILVERNRILFVVSGFYLCKRVNVGRGKYPEIYMFLKVLYFCYSHSSHGIETIASVLMHDISLKKILNYRVGHAETVYI